MPENRLNHLIHAGVPENRLTESPQARLGNKNNPDIVEIDKATRWKPGQSGNPGGRPKRTPYADACRAVGDLTAKELEENPTMAKALMRQALRGGIGALQAASELMDRAEGRPVQAIGQQTEESSIAALGPELFAATVRIIMATCAAFNLPVPDFLAEAQRLIESGELERPAGCGAADDTAEIQRAMDQAAEDKCKTG